MKRLQRLCAVAALVSLGACVSETSFRDMIQQVEKERSKNEQLTLEVTQLRSEIEALGREKVDRQRSMEELLKKVDSQARTMKTLSRKSPGKPRVITKTKVVTKVVTKEKQPDMSWAKTLTSRIKKEFREEIRVGELRVKETPDRLIISLSDLMLFERDDVRVALEGEEVLARLGKILRNIQHQTILVGGHLDTTPIAAAMALEYPTAWEFTGARAVDVVRFLEEESKVSGTIMSAVAYGSARPVSTNTTEKGRTRNRRIDIVLLPG